MLRRGAACAVAVAAAFALPAAACAAPSFSTVPALPALPAVKLNAAAQTTNAAMTNFAVKEGAESGGWNVTVAGQSGVGKSAVFAQYCPEAGGCSGDAFGYVAGGKTLPASSLRLTSTGASFTGGGGTAPTLQCSASCPIDAAKAEKVASKAVGGAGGSTWTTTGFSATSLALKTPSTLFALKPKEVYRVNVLWTLATGP